ncbi:hypothetical protein M5E88_02475 [Akkermansia muciniphila]|nr:hypothetical protein M5E88_02475 [Akkermansia muciniphila]
MKTLDVSSADFLDMAESPSYNRLSFGEPPSPSARRSPGLPPARLKKGK